jgi:phthalate 4,5-dioxygenase
MLNRSDNELLCRVGADTQMGKVLRQYWHPILLTSELAEKDGAPLRVRLLGENLVAFRDTAGEVGLVAENCPHRGASLFFGRNEEEGLRCVYHGWKYNTSGACVDMPNEPPESNFKHKVKVTAYRTRERGGVIWAYMGTRETPPELPSLEWNMVPSEQVYVSKRYSECNWVQGVEGGVDSSHSGFLHSPLSSHRVKDESEHEANEELRTDGGSRGMIYKAKDKHPHFEVVDTDYGVLVGARRKAEEDSWYWRITQFLMPYFSMIPSYGESPKISGHAWVPIDDYTTMAWTATWHPTRALTEKEVERMHYGWNLHLGVDTLDTPIPGKPGSEWRPKANASNDYLIDWEAQRTKVFSGLPGTAMQDQALQETMGAIYARWNEHLGTSDTGIIQMRRRWLKAARELEADGTVPCGVDAPDAYMVRSAGIVLPRDCQWVEECQEFVRATPGVHHASA